MSEIKYLHRYTKMCGHEELESVDDENNVRLVLNTYEVVRETKEGYWFKIRIKGNWVEKWTSKTSRKRFAFPTKKEALTSFMKRAKRSIVINDYQKRFSELAIKKAVDLMTMFEHSEEFIETHSPPIQFSHDDMKLFIESCENPPKANEKLKRAKERHDEFIKKI